MIESKTMDKIKVSIIILTYNHSKYIRQAIKGVLRQEVSFPIEIIIADDKSTDHTQRILKEFQEKYPNLIKLILHEKNIGTTRNICDAFQKSKGEYLIGFGGDDYWIDTEKLQTQVNWLDNHPDYIGVSHVIESRNNAGLPLGRFPNSRLIGKTVSSKFFLKCFYFSTSATMFRNIFKSENAKKYIDLITQNRLVEDVSLAMILLDLGKVYVMDRCMAVYRRNNNDSDSNYNSIRNSIQSYQDHIEVYSANERFFQNKYDFTRLYTEKTIFAFFWSIKNHKIIVFSKLFKKIPTKAKIVSLMILPLFLLKISWHRLTAIISLKLI